MRALQLAEKRLGLSRLCERLGASEATIRAWQSGGSEMPHQDFLRLVDLILEIAPDALFPKPEP
jgi:transcriptional regulator with XRE-family HTH domain